MADYDYLPSVEDRTAFAIRCGNGPAQVEYKTRMAKVEHAWAAVEREAARARRSLGMLRNKPTRATLHRLIDAAMAAEEHMAEAAPAYARERDRG